MSYRVEWDNGIDCGVFPQRFDTEEEAEEAGAAWRAEMIRMDPSPTEAAEVYTYEVVEVQA